MYAGLLTLSLLLSQVPVVALPCVQGDSTVICSCKQGMASACSALAASDEETLKGLLRAAWMAHAAQEAEKGKAHAADVVDTGCGSGQDPNEKEECSGQSHHVISKAVWFELERHAVLGGKYIYRDPRFVTQAKDLKAHCGYQKWHRSLDGEIVAWLKKFDMATVEQFEEYLKDLFTRPDLRARFPNGL